MRPLQTLAEPARRAARGRLLGPRRAAPTRDDALGLAFLEVNALGDTLREQRLGALEATALLRTVMDEIDVAVFAFDDGADRCGWSTAPASGCSRQPAERLLGRDAGALGLARLPDRRGRTRTVEHGLRRAARDAGNSDAASSGRAAAPHRCWCWPTSARTLREEERQAWQRLVRVLSHEINNSLAPIKSIAGQLADALDRAEPDDEDLEADLARGLAVIASPGRGAQPLHVRATRGWPGCRRRPRAPLDVGDVGAAGRARSRRG